MPTDEKAPQVDVDDRSGAFSRKKFAAFFTFADETIPISCVGIRQVVIAPDIMTAENLSHRAEYKPTGVVKMFGSSDAGFGNVVFQDADGSIKSGSRYIFVTASRKNEVSHKDVALKILLAESADQLRPLDVAEALKRLVKCAAGALPAEGAVQKE